MREWDMQAMKDTQDSEREINALVQGKCVVVSVSVSVWSQQRELALAWTGLKGFSVGAKVGPGATGARCDGFEVGCTVGCSDGCWVGTLDGSSVVVGPAVLTICDGCELGAAEGNDEGSDVGTVVGCDDGRRVISCS